MIAAAHPLAHVNAVLNAIAGVMLVLGYIQIRSGREDAHRRFMLLAFGVSALFLVCYVAHHLQVGSVKFSRGGFVRAVYLNILVSHIVLAAVIVPLAFVTIEWGLRATGRRGFWDTARMRSKSLNAEQITRYRIRHKRIAPWTFLIWLYVSITGVFVYAMLYHVFPDRGG